MIIIKLIICFFIMFIVPILLGMLVNKKTKNKNILLDFALGYMVEFSILQIIAIPMIFLNFKYTTLLYTWISIIFLLLIISIISNFKKELLKKENLLRILKKIKNETSMITIIAIILVLLQAAVPIMYTYTNDDDSFFVATATISIYENSMYRVAAEDGTFYGGLPSRYVLAPFSMYLAIVSSILNISPAIVAHSIFPPVFIILAYAIYTLLGEKLFNKDKTNVSIFIILLSILHIFGNYSDRTNFTYLLLRVWQGKAVLSSIMLPMIWFMFLNCIEEDKKLINWGMLLITMFASLLVSEMSIALAPMTLMMLAFVFAIRDKKISYLLKSAVCVIPSVIYFLVYLFIR